MDKISIIVPVYNGEKFLKMTVDTIQKSNYKNLEIILINDGSTDSSYEICKEMASDDKRIVVVDQINQGIATARNKGIEISTGEWIAFCDQDDIVDIRIYELLLKRTQRDKSEIAICGTGKLINNHFESFEIYQDMVLGKKDIIDQAMYSILFDGYKLDEGNPLKIKMGNCIWKCLIKKELISKNNIMFRQFVNFEDDRTFLLELLAAADRISLLKECLYYWRINLQSETYRKKYIFNMKRKMEDYQLYEKNIFQKAGIPEKVQNEYFKVENCNNYVQLIENELGIPNEKSLRNKIKFLNDLIYDKDFDTNITERKKLKKNIIKKKIVLFLLEKRLLYLAYFFDAMYLSIKKRALTLRIFTIVERKAEKRAR